jgi:hypothetical protein
MSVLESFGQLKDQAVKADNEIMSVAEKDEPAIEAQADDTRRQADQQAADLGSTTKSSGGQGNWQEIQADWNRHIARARERLGNAKTGYDMSVTEAEAESAEADALNAIAFAASAILEAEQATLDAVLARRHAAAVAATP